MVAGRNPFRASIAPWLVVRDAERALTFYRAAFGAVEEYRLDTEQGDLVVARLSIGGARFWIQDDPDAGPLAPGVGSVRMILSVEDPDTVFDPATTGRSAGRDEEDDDRGRRPIRPDVRPLGRQTLPAHGRTLGWARTVRPSREEGADAR